MKIFSVIQTGKMTLSSLKFIHKYLNDRKRSVIINNQYSSFKEILFGIPQGSILGPLL